jgi:hypothetical protein
MLRKMLVQFALVLGVGSVLVAGPAGSASAYTADGPGAGAGAVTIERPKFTGYQCSHYSTYRYPSGQVRYRYNCAGGVYIHYWGERRWGNKCVEHVTGSGWGWYGTACWNL